MMQMLLQVSASDPVLVDRVAEHPIARVDLEGLHLQAGEFVQLAIVNWTRRKGRCVLLVGDDPPRPDGIAASLPVRADPGDHHSIKVRRTNVGQRHLWKDVKFIEVYESNRWINYLPAVFREERENAEFLSRYLGALFVDGEKIEEQLDRAGDLIVPSRLPSLDAARFLASWFDIDLDLVFPAAAIPEGQSREVALRNLGAVRKFLSRVLPQALSVGTVASLSTWIDAVCEARGMPIERRSRVALIEGFKMRRLFTLPVRHREHDPEPTGLRRDWGWLPNSATLAADPLAWRAFLDKSRFNDGTTLGVPDESRDEALLARLLGCRLWLFLPPRMDGDPTPQEWMHLLAPVLPAHLTLEVVDAPVPFLLGRDTILGMTTHLPPLPLGSATLGQDSLLPHPKINGSSKQ